MERRFGLIGPSRSAYGQAFWGSGVNAPMKNFLVRFVVHCESCVQDVKNCNFEIRVWLSCFLRERKNTVAILCIFFLDNS